MKNEATDRALKFIEDADKLERLLMDLEVVRKRMENIVQLEGNLESGFFVTGRLKVTPELPNAIELANTGARLLEKTGSIWQFRAPVTAIRRILKLPGVAFLDVDGHQVDQSADASDNVG